MLNITFEKQQFSSHFKEELRRAQHIDADDNASEAQ